jgi:hypothetical protein
VDYLDPVTTQDLKSSGFPNGEYPQNGGFAMILVIIKGGYLPFAMLFMQHWGLGRRPSATKKPPKAYKTPSEAY